MNEKQHDNADKLRKDIKISKDRITRIESLKKNHCETRKSKSDFKMCISQGNGTNSVPIPEYLAEAIFLQVDAGLNADLKKLEKEYEEL